MEQKNFDLWCIVELFGHNRIAGRRTEQNVAGTNMLRVDVPDTWQDVELSKDEAQGLISYLRKLIRKID